MNGHDEVLEVLGGVLGSILITPDDTEEAELILAGIGDLKRIHLQVLRILSDPTQDPRAGQGLLRSGRALRGARSNEGRLPPKEADHEGFVMQESDAWNAEALASKAGLSLTRTQLAVQDDERRIRAVATSSKWSWLHHLAGRHVNRGGNPALASGGLRATAPCGFPVSQHLSCCKRLCVPCLSAEDATVVGGLGELWVRIQPMLQPPNPASTGQSRFGWPHQKTAANPSNEPARTDGMNFPAVGSGCFASRRGLGAPEV